MRKRIYPLAGAVVLILTLTALFMGLFSFGPDRQPTAPPKVQAQGGQVAGASDETADETGDIVLSSATTPKPTPVRVVVSDGTRSKTITYTPPAGQQPESPQPSTPSDPSDPVQPPPRPDEITINLRGPLEYRLQPGGHSPILTYEITDGVQREWFPGHAAVWMDQPKPASTPVWATVLEKQASRPYTDDHVYFFVAARPDAQPGTYKTTIRMVVRPGITLGVSVMVTVSNKVPVTH